MKFPIISTVAVTMAALASTVSADIKVASVDVNMLYTKYHKRFDTEVRLKQAMTEIQNDAKKRQEELIKLKEEFEKLKATYDPSRSEKEINALRQQLEKKQAQYVAKENDLKTFLSDREKLFKEMYTRDISELFSDVQECISKEAAGMNYDLVIDSSAMNSAPRTKISPTLIRLSTLHPPCLRSLMLMLPPASTLTKSSRRPASSCRNKKLLHYRLSYEPLHHRSSRAHGRQNSQHSSGDYGLRSCYFGRSHTV